MARAIIHSPDFIIADEPTGNLDSESTFQMADILIKANQIGNTIVLVTHLMDDVAEFADQVYVIEKGKLVKSGKPSLVFQNVEFMEKIQLGVPKITRFAQRLAERGVSFKQLPITIEEFKEFING